MTQITTLDQTRIRELVYAYMDDAEAYKRNPHAIQRLSLDLLEQVTQGKVDLVDATNPFVFLLESSALNAGLAINEYYLNLRKQYPELAIDRKDLYLHMSDTEYLNIYSVPAKATFTFAISLTDIIYNEVYDVTDRSYKLIIPRGSSVNVDNRDFLLLYPIVIRKFDNGFIQVSYDANIQNSLEPLTSSIIDYTIKKDINGQEWLMFDITLPQLKHASYITSIDDMATYRHTVTFENDFHWAEVYYRSNTDSAWTRLNTVMNEVNYDYFQVTAVLKVYNQKLEVLIPNFYQLAAGLNGEVRIDVYTTVGRLTMDMRLYTIQNFGLKFGYFDEVRDTSVFSARMMTAQHYVFSTEDIDDGRSAVSFEELRRRVIENSLGNYLKLPISHVQLKNNILDNNFELIDHVDDITRKTILAVRRLPKADTPKYIAEMNAGIYPAVFKLSEIQNNYRVRNHPNEASFTIMSNSVYLEHDGRLSLLDYNEVNYIKTLPTEEFVQNVNSHQYVFSPFYYVVDKTKDYDAVRIYELDTPKFMARSILYQNQTLRLIVQTSNLELIKTEAGYTIRLQTKSGSNFRSLSPADIKCQLIFQYKDTDELLYINAELVATLPDQERIFEAHIDTNYFIDKDDCMYTDSLTPYGETTPRGSRILLSGKMQVIFMTSAVDAYYTRSELEDVINYGITPNTFVGISKEEIEYEFGHPIKNLYRRIRNFPDADNYQRYTEDIYRVYEEDVYQIDPATGSKFSVDADGNLVYTILHHKGDIVLDENGDPIVLHRKGDTVFDAEGNPILLPFDELYKELDIYYLEGHYFFLDRVSVTSYVNKVKRVISEWSSIDLERIKENIILVNNLYYYPKTSLGIVKAIDEYNVECRVKAPQSLQIKIWLYKEYFYDDNLKRSIDYFVKSYLTEIITGTVINNNDIIKDIKARFSTQIHLVTVSQLGGELDRLSFRMADQKESFCIAKRYYIEDDGSVEIEEGITVQFFIVS